MKNTDTPETDAEAFQFSAGETRYQSDWVKTDFARKLERERDEARSERDRLDVSGIHSCHNECQRPVCKLRRERDALKEALIEMRYGHTHKAESMAIAALQSLENVKVHTPAPTQRGSQHGKGGDK